MWRHARELAWQSVVGRVRVFLVIWILANALTVASAQRDVLASSDSEPSVPDPAAESTITLTLDEALEIALRQNPELAAFAWEFRAADAQILRASARPNPELSVDIEDVRLNRGPASITEVGSFGLSADLGQSTETMNAQSGRNLATLLQAIRNNRTKFSGFGTLEREKEQGVAAGIHEAQFTLSLSQLIELGRKRARRMAVAEREKALVQWDYEVTKADVLSEVAKAYLSILGAQKRHELNEELEELSAEVLGVTKIRADAGKIAPIEVSKSEIPMIQAQMGLERSERERNAAILTLGSLLGVDPQSAIHVEGALEQLPSFLSMDEIREHLARNPDLARWNDELEHRENVLRLERSNRIPDVTVAAGVRVTGLPETHRESIGRSWPWDSSFTRSRTYYESDHDVTFVLGLSVPLPVFDRNQGGIKEAEALAGKVTEDRKAAHARVRAKLAETYAGFSASHNELQRLNDEILPRAREVFELTREGYQIGKFDYLELLDAQRAFFESREQYVNTLAEYHQQYIDIQRLTGGISNLVKIQSEEE